MQTQPRVSHFLFTVGTGTAGKHSNLSQGLINGIRHAPPYSVVGLIPSNSPDSQTIAELVIEELKRVRPDISATQAGTLSDPDDLLSCRREFRLVLQNLISTTPHGNLTVNPTSGTKQMTAAATLACLDAGMGQIEFITGDRVDGVVKTGTERVSRVDAARLQAEQRVQAMLVLLENGNYAAAQKIASLIQKFFPFTAAATAMLACWHRLAYADALRAASGFEELAESRRLLDRLRSAADYSVERGADVVALARRELEFDRPEEALSAIYRAVELLAKARLCELECPPEVCFADNLNRRLHPEERLRKDLLRMQQTNPDQPLILGLEKCLWLLESDGFSLSKMDARYRAILRQRNETRFGHGSACVPSEDVRRLYDAVCTRACEQWPEMKALLSGSVFPDIAPMIQKELNHE